MKRDSRSPAVTKYLLCFSMAVLFYASGADGAPATAQNNRAASAIDKSLARMMMPGTQDLQLIIELKEPSVLEKMSGGVSPRQLNRSRPLSERYQQLNFETQNALQYRQQVEQSQQPVMSSIQALSGAKILGTTDVVMNTVIARVSASNYSAIRNLPGVKKVYFSRPQRMLLDQAAVLQNAQGLWNSVGGQSKAGDGIKIGLIDTGIDITNAMFNGAGMSTPAGYPKTDTTADRAFTNSKVIAARSYVSLLPNTQSIQTAVDEVGHGTFVAGCAAGQSVAAPLATISGMAPGAYLGNYKVFGTPGINDSTTTAAVLAAINDAAKDGMNIINLSLGALDYIPPAEDAEAIALENAIQSGIVVTIAAGNNGPMTHSIGSPGTTADAITVGSVTNDRAFLATIHTSDPGLSTIGYLPSSDGVQVTSNIAFTDIVDVSSLDGNGLGCAAFPMGSLNGTIAYIERGTCSFATKGGNAAAAGAKAVILYNNVSAGIASMSGLSSVAIPVVMISQSDGASLKQYIDSNPGTAKVAIDNSQSLQSVPVTARVVSSFSSVGPGMDFGIKPDLVAVGENVYSATERSTTSGLLYDPSGFTIGQGTSFSAPMAAGAAAGLRQHFPSLGALAIKSLLTTAASRNLTIDGTHAPDVLSAGSGLLNMGNAVAAGAVFSPTSLNFGVHSYAGSLTLTANLTIENISSTSDQYTLGIEPVNSGPIITFNPNNTDAVGPGSSTTIAVTLQITAPNSGGFQGFVTVTSASSFVYRIPYWAGIYVPDTSHVLQVSQSASGSGVFSNLADALAAAQPGNIIEIQDSARYPVGTGGLVISTNSQGIPLHGITIRAAAGQTPVIDGSALSSSGNPADIQVVGLQNVLLKGLNINGGYTGIELYQPSTAVPLSVTIDHCTISNSAGDLGASGVWIDGGGTVEILHSTISGSSGTGIIAGAYSDGTQLTILNGTVQANGFDGMDVWGANVVVSNSTFILNSGAGAYFDHCSGTVDGNTFAQNQALPNSYGDGLQIADGNLTVRNNQLDSNGDAGVALFPGLQTGLGPNVQVTGNTIRLNGYFGIYSGSAISVVADSNLIEDNAGGVFFAPAAFALLLNNIIVRSTDSGIGDGVALAGASTVRIVNNTIYGNRLHGVELAGGSVSMSNTIVFGNAGGNLSGVPSSSVNSSLVSIDPKFTNPASDDFSLASGSPAIDAGSNSASNLPFLDYHGQLRVSSATRLPGDGTVDIGAEEANSGYPLVYPLILNGDEPSIGGSFTTGIAFSNPTDSAAQVNLTAYDGTGGLLASSSNPALKPLPVEGQLAILDYQLFGFDSNAAALGGVLASSDMKLAGFDLFVDPQFSHFATGANATMQSGTDIVFMRHESDSNGSAAYVLFNPGVNTANITATLHGSAGTGIGQSQNAAIAPKGQIVMRFDTSALSSGYVRIQSDRPVSGVEVVGNANRFAALGGFSPESQSRLFFPHFAVGGNYSTQVAIVNAGSSAVNVTLTAYDDSGNFRGKLGSIALQAGGQLMDTISNLFGISAASNQLQTGYLIAEGDQPGLMGFTDFSYDDGIHSSDATIPADSVPSHHLLFSHIAQGINAGDGVPYSTGIALLNPFGTEVSYTMSVYDGTGALVAQAVKTIGPHQKVAKILFHPVEGVGFFSPGLVLGNGHVEISTDYGLLGLELFFTDNVSQLASVPAQVP